MGIPKLSMDEIEQLCGYVTQYIKEQRRMYRSNAVAVPDDRKAALAGFFRPEVLTRARLVLGSERVRNPAFYPKLKARGFGEMPDFSAMAAITFIDTIVVREVVLTDPLLFHELVHVEQYGQLGVVKFSQLYVCGFLSGGSYDAIPLERSAYGLQSRFEDDPTCGFSIADDVRDWITANSF